MGNDITKEKIFVKKHNEINEYISIRIIISDISLIRNEEDLDKYNVGKTKIVIQVKDKPIISIPSIIFPSFEHIIQEINIHIDYNAYQKENTLPEVVFQRLVQMLHAWIKNDYNSQFLYYKIAFPLLQELREIGETRFQIIFQQEILRTYTTCSRQVKEFLEYEGYLKLIGEFF